MIVFPSKVLTKIFMLCKVCGVVDISFAKVIRANQIKAVLTKFSHKLRPPAYCQILPSLCLWRYDDVVSEIPTFGKSVRL